MRRRAFIAGLGSAAAWPLAARAQQPAMPVIGFLSVGAPLGADDPISFRKGLSEIGFVEGRNVAIEYRFAEGQYDRVPAMVTELVDRRVTVIAASGLIAALAARPQPQPFRSFSGPAMTRFDTVLSPASTGPAATSPA